MAKSSSSSRFVSVNLSKSYGQPPSPSPGHGGSISVASGSSPTAYRTRVQSGNNGMVVLSRPGRSQPSASASTSRTSKLAVPSPVNLPSRRREHAGNDPTVALVGASGSSGWSKQQISTLAGDSVMAGQSVAVESAAVRSTSMVSDSSWSSTASQGRVAEQQDFLFQAGTSFYQAPIGKSTLYTPPSSRNATAFNIVHTQPSEKVMVVRGEDFPTLQAAARPFVPTLHRQKDVQQKQQDKQHKGKDQHAKLQQLSQQQSSKAEDAGPQLQPVRPPEISKQPGSREGQSYEMRRASEKRVSNSYGGPSPLIRLTHTSNWADDERETLQSVHQHAVMQSDRLEAARPRNGYHLSDSRVLDHKGPVDSGHPMSRHGSLSGYGRDFNDSQDHEKDAGFGLEGRSTRDTMPRNGVAKSLSNKQFDVDSWEDIANWSRGPGRNDPLKRGWSFTAKETNYDRDGRLGSSGRSFNTKNAGFEREINTNVQKNAYLPYRGDNFGSTVSTREVRSRDGSSKPNMYLSKHGVNDRLGDRSRRSIGNYHLGSGNLGRAQSDLSGLDYGREKRVSSLYGQDPFSEEPSSSKPSSSLVLETFIGTPGLGAKMSRRKKDESQNFHDPARELFEAELERVQRMQEQERQRLVEERERAIELARKEEEERERLAKEEELLRLKMEEESREAAAQARRKAEDAARKVEEVRLAREEEKRMVILEEERRKEAAKQKLLDLEQRMAQREALQYQRSYSGTEVSIGSAERSSRQKEEDNRALPSFNKFASNEEHALGIDNARPMPLESTARLPADTRGEGVSGDRSRVVQMKRRETLDDGLGLPLTVKKYHLRDDPPWSENEREYRGFSMRESSLGPNRSFPLGASRSSTLAHGQANTDPFARNKSWQSGHSDRFSGGQFPTDINAGYMEAAIESDNDGWWARDERRRFQDGQRLNSPPFYMTSGENDYPLFGRLRQSLPKQPRVPPPIFGRPTFHRQVSQSETMPAVSFPHSSDVSEGQGKGGSNVNSEEVISGSNSKKADYVDKILIEAPVEGKSGLPVPIEDFVPPQYTMKVSDETEKAGLTSESQTCKDEMLQPDEIDELSEQLSDLTESEERLGEDEKQLVVDAQLARTVEPADDEDGWLVQARVEDMDEEMCVNKFENEVAVEDASDEQEWDSSRVLKDVTTNVEQHGTEKEEVDDSTWENQLVEDEGNGVVDDPEKAAETQWESNEAFAPKINNQNDTELKDLGSQDAVKDHVVQLQNVLSSANTFDFARVGHSESHTHGQSFLQHFQQPFSFMAVPLSQSTALNGVASHPPMLPSMHGVQAHQEVPYHLQMGLLSGTPLMPNAIQIGSIQMPLQVHPQMPPVGHLHHHQQPPVFQFGQLCPFSQPLPPMQPAVQMHHAMGQPLSAQHYQAEFFSPVEGSHLSKVDDIGQKPEEMAMQSPYGLCSDLKSPLENPADSLGGCLSSGEHIDCSSASCSISQNHLPSAEGGHDAAASQGVDASIETSQETSVGKILSGRRTNSSVRSSGIYGRGRGRSHTRKNHDHEDPYSVSEAWPENTANEEVRSRIYRQTFHQAEYKVRKSLQTSERDPNFSVDHENRSSSYVKDVNASDGLRNAQMPSTEDTSEMTHYLYSQSLEGSNSQHAEGLPRLQSPQVGFGSVQADATLPGLIRSANTLTISTEGNGFNSDDLGDAPLQSGVDFVYEEQASEVQNEKEDDFIEVRSKRQLLREQRELRDKAKSRELKVKEQVARKQQKVVGKPVLHEAAAINQGRAVKQLPAVIGSGLQQFRATPTSIGLPAAASSDLKVSKSGHYQLEAVAMHPDSGKELAFEHRYFSDALDTTMTINTAWGVQRSSHEVVSLTQVQLEETMKPYRFDGISSQLAAIVGGGPTVLEQGITPSSGSVEKVSAPAKASVSMPGPISSLLAGEKIQFGAVTSPTVISSPSHPPSPSFVGAIGSQLGADMANISSHPVSHTRNYFGQDTNGGFLPSKMITRAEDDVNRQLVDSEAEAEAAASAVAVAAICNEEAVGLDGTGAGIIQAPSKSLGVDDSMSVALPVDLSLETPAPLLQASLPSHPVSSDIMIQSLPSRASPFPCLEMGTILGGPVFAYGPRDDAPLSSFEPGFAGVGAGNIAGWQHRHSNTSDSFYGAPPPFMSPAGLPSIQGHPHMLVYTNPFAPVGQFGQLGVSFMGSAYHPSGKQPDWTHTAYTTSPGSLNQSGVDINAGLPVMMDPQHGGVASNSAQAISVAGCSMMPAMSLFDPNFSSSFQAPWSRGASSPFSSYHVAGPAPGLNLQSRASVVPGELGRFVQSMHASDNSHQLPETSNLRMAGDMRMSGDGGGSGGVPGVNFPDELGFGYPVLAGNAGLNNVEILSNRGFCAGLADLPGSNLQQGQSIPQNVHGNLNLASVSSRNEAFLGTHDARGDQLESSHAQTSDLEQQGSLGHLSSSSLVTDKRPPQQVQARGSLVTDYQRRGSSRTVSTVSAGERGPASSPKPKQIYVAKPAAPVGAT